MKDFINCPKCNKPLLNEASITRDGRDIWNKRCISASHSFTCIVIDPDGVSAIMIVTDINNNVIANWKMDNQTLCIVKGKNVVNIPFFEPDFSDYDKLIQKLKTYVTFS